MFPVRIVVSAHCPRGKVYALSAEATEQLDPDLYRHHPGLRALVVPSEAEARRAYELAGQVGAVVVAP